MPAVSSSLISPALEKLEDLPLVTGRCWRAIARAWPDIWRVCLIPAIRGGCGTR